MGAVSKAKGTGSILQGSILKEAPPQRARVCPVGEAGEAARLAGCFAAAGYSHGRKAECEILSSHCKRWKRRRGVREAPARLETSPRILETSPRPDPLRAPRTRLAKNGRRWTKGASRREMRGKDVQIISCVEESKSFGSSRAGCPDLSSCPRRICNCEVLFKGSAFQGDEFLRAPRQGRLLLCTGAGRRRKGALQRRVLCHWSGVAAASAWLPDAPLLPKGRRLHALKPSQRLRRHCSKRVQTRNPITTSGGPRGSHEWGQRETTCTHVDDPAAVNRPERRRRSGDFEGGFMNIGVQCLAEKIKGALPLTVVRLCCNHTNHVVAHKPKRNRDAGHWRTAHEPVAYRRLHTVS